MWTTFVTADAWPGSSRLQAPESIGDHLIDRRVSYDSRPAPPARCHHQWVPFQQQQQLDLQLSATPTRKRRWAELDAAADETPAAGAYLSARSSLRHGGHRHRHHHHASALACGWPEVDEELDLDTEWETILRELSCLVSSCPDLTPSTSASASPQPDSPLAWSPASPSSSANSPPALETDGQEQLLSGQTSPALLHRHSRSRRSVRLSLTHKPRGSRGNYVPLAPDAHIRYAVAANQGREVITLTEVAPSLRTG